MSYFELWAGKLTSVNLGSKNVEEWLRDFLDEPNLEKEDLLFTLSDKHYQEFFFNEATDELYAILQYQFYINHQNPALIIGEDVEFDKYNYLGFTKNDDGSFNFVTSFYNGSRSLNDMLTENIFTF